jgi:MCP family monocarboxylic acid transporter-like MFS transporter 10
LLNVFYFEQLKLVEVNFEGEDGKILVTCIGITSGLGRLCFGRVADIHSVNRILLQQVRLKTFGNDASIKW